MEAPRMSVLSTSKNAAADGSGTGGGAATSAAAAAAAPALAAAAAAPALAVQLRPGTMRPRIPFISAQSTGAGPAGRCGRRWVRRYDAGVVRVLRGPG